MQCTLMIQSISGFETVSNILKSLTNLSQEIIFKLANLANVFACYNFCLGLKQKWLELM